MGILRPDPPPELVKGLGPNGAEGMDFKARTSKKLSDTFGIPKKVGTMVPDNNGDPLS